MKRSLRISVLVSTLFTFIVSSVYAIPPTITPSGPSVAAVSTTYGTPSSNVSFTFTAAALAAGETVTISAPSGFEVSLTAGSGYAASVTKNADGSGNIASTSIFVRLAAATSVGSYSGNVSLNGTTASANVATTSSTVSAKALTMTGLSVPASKVYDGSTGAVVSGAAALLSSEAIGSGTNVDGKPYTGDVVSITGTAVGTYNTKDVATATTVTYSGLSLTGAQSTNYTLTIQSPASAAITAKTLTLDGTLTTSASKVYDGTTSASFSGSAVLFAAEAVGAGTTSDFKPYTGDVVTISGSPVGTYNTKDVATATTITISGLSLGGAQAGNYTLSVASASSTITAKPLTMNGLTVPASKIYDGTTTAVVGGSASLQSSEATGAGSAADGKPYTGDVVSITGTPAGTYNSKNVATATTVTYSGLSLTGADAGNYSFTIQSAASATITAKALTMSGLSVPASKIYDGTTAAVVSGSAALQASEAVGAGTTADGIPYTGDAVSITGTAAGNYNSKNVATATTVTYSGLSLTGAQAGNYSLTIQSSASATISTKSLTVSGAVANNKTFDGTTAATIGGSPALQTAEAPGAGSTADGTPYTGDAVSISGSGTGTFASSAVGTGISVTGVAGYSLTGGQAGNYTITQPTGLTASIFSTKPTAQSTAFVFSSITNTTMTVSWTVPGAGGGNNRILVVKQGGAPTAPTNGTASTSPTTYTANPAFGSGSTTAAGSFVVYIGNGNSVALTGFAANTSYTFNLYEFNSAGSGTENYLTTSPLSQSQTTEDEPLNYPTAFTAAATTSAGNPVITLNWTGSIGSPAPANYLVLARDVTNSGAFPAFSDGSSVPGNDNDLSSQGSTWNGSQIVAFGTNTYNGWANNKLTAGNLYEFQINPYTTAGIINPDYKTTPAAPTIQVYTEPTASASNPTFSNITSNSIDVTVAGGTGLGPVGGYIVTRKVGSAPLTAPTDGTVYTTASTIGGDPVVYVGPATTFTDGSLTSLTNYFYNVYVYSGAGALINYKTNAPGNANTTTLCTPPVTQATSVTFGTTTAGSMVVNWTNGSGNDRIVIVNSSPITFVPSSGTSYTPNIDFSAGTNLGSGQKCVFNGTGNTVTVTGLSGATTYYYAVYEYNTTGTCYNLVSPATGNKLTPSASTTSTFTAGSGGNLASTVITQGGEAAVFTFTASDLGVDNVSTRFTQLIFRPGAGNQVADWTQLFGTTGHAELYDNAGFGPAQHGTAVITANTITIPGISANGPPDLGSISDNTTRVYTLKVWLLSSLGGTLPSTVDNKNIEFSISGNDATPVPTKSQFSAVTTTSSGADAITVTATQIKINQQPTTSAFAGVVLGTQPIFEATDANNNRDLDINNSITVNTTNPTNLGPSNAPTNFVLGLADFTASGFKFLNVGSSTMNVAITTPNLTSPNSSLITVTSNTIQGTSALSMAANPLINGTVGSITAGVATNAILGFSIQTSGASTTLTDLNFTSSVSTVGLVKNFKLYSNTSDSFTGATQVATSSSLTFTGMSIPVSSTIKYFYLVCDVEPYFPSLNPTIQFYLPQGNFTVASGGSKTGVGQTSTFYTLQDLTPPDIQSIAIASPVNAWSTTNGTSASAVQFTVTFTEPVSGVNATDFRVVTDGTVATFPANKPSGLSGSGTTYTVTVSNITGNGHLRLELVDNNSIIDVANNAFEGGGLTDYLTDFTNTAWYYSIVLPQPNAVNGFSITLNNLEIYIQYLITYNPAGQSPTNFLIMARESQGVTPFPTFGTPSLNDGVLLTDDPYDGTYAQFAGDGLYIQNVSKSGATTQSGFQDGLKSGVYYDFIIYPYTRNNSFYSDDNIDYGPPTLVSNYFIPTGINSTLGQSPVNNPIASTIDTNPEAQNVFSFTLTDGTGTSGWESAPTKFSALTIRELLPTDNVSDWSAIIAGAELYDTSSPSTFVSASSITTNQIIFTGIPSVNNTDLGVVPRSSLNYSPFLTSSKTYGLRIYFKNTAGALTGSDDLQLAFTISNADFTYATPAGTVGDHQASTTITAGATASSGINTITITASQLVITNQPSAAALVLTNLGSDPVLKAEDVNGNLDKDYNNTITISTAGGMALTNAPANASLGVITFPLAFQYNDSGDGTLTVNGTGAPAVTPATTNAVNVSYSSATTLSLGSAPNLKLSSITSSAAPVSVFNFTIRDDGGAGNDGAPTRVSSIIVRPGGGDQFSPNWNTVIGGAVLKVGATTIPCTAVVNGNNITFTGIPSTLSSDLGYIADNGFRVYTVAIWFNSNIGSFQANGDNKQFFFSVTQSDISLAPLSSGIIPGATTVTSTNNFFDVEATKLVFTSDYTVSTLLPGIDVTAQQGNLVLKAEDANGNIDTDYVANVNITNAGVIAMNPGALTTLPVSGVLGVYNFPGGFRYLTTGNGQITATPTSTNAAGGPVTSALSQPVTIQAGQATTISNGAAAPATISSLVNSSGSAVAVLNFNINDDPSPATPANNDDGLPTLISSVVVTANSTFNSAILNDWRQAIAGAILTDGTNSYTVDFAVTPAAITANSMTFGVGTPIATGVGQLGYVTDNGTKSYSVKIWLKSVLGGTLPSTIDGAQFEFEVLKANITLAANSTGIIAGQSSNSGNKDVVTVVATQLDITSPATAANASISTNFPGVVVKARDANANLDLGFNGKITSLTNQTSATMINGPITSGPSQNTFTSGVYSFNSNFQFTSGSNGDVVTLAIKADNTGGTSGTNCGTNAICSGITPTITLKTSFESSLQLDPTFKPTLIPLPKVSYINYLDSTNFATTKGYELVRLLLVDGSKTSYNYTNQNSQTGVLDTNSDAELNGNGDSDGATSNLNSLSIRVFGAASLSRIALFDSTGTVVPSTIIDVTALGLNRSPAAGVDTTSHVFTWAGSLITAKDNSQAPFSIRATFRATSSHIHDTDPLQVKLIDAQLGTGSQFYNKGLPGYIGGGNHSPNTPSPVGQVDVIATSLDFTTQGSSYAGINEPVGPSYTSSPLPSTSAGVVKARDKYTNLDLEFNQLATAIIITDNVGDNIAAPAGFVNGQLNLDGMIYTLSGDGTLKVKAGGLDSSLPPVANVNAIKGQLVNVVNLVATYPGAGIITGQGSPLTASIKGGSQGQVIFGVTFTAQGATASEPKLKKFSFTFDVPYSTSSQTIFENFVVKEGNVDITSPTINGNLVFSSSASNSNLDIITVDLSAIPRSLYSAPGQSLTYYLIVDVDATANIATPAITPKFVDGGYLTATNSNIVVTQGTASGSFDGNVYTFASTKPPVLKTAKSSLTYPYAGQLNVDPALDHILLEFDTKVISLDGGLARGAELYDRATNAKVADLIAPLSAGNYLYTNDYALVPSLANPLRYNIKFLPGKSFKNDSIYYVIIKKGSFDQIAKTGLGISDQGLNFYGGISSSSTLYFKISSSQPLLLTKAKGVIFNNSVGSISTSFDQFGTAYYLVVPGGSSAPTASQVKTSATYPGTVSSSGSYVIDQINTTSNAAQTAVFTAKTTFTLGATYDVYIYAENNALPTPVPSGGVYGSNLKVNSGGPTFSVTLPLTPPAYQPVYLICPNSFVNVTDPILISESSIADFSAGTLLSPTVQDFNILLPPGYEFDGITKPTVQLIGADFNGALATTSFVSNTVLKVSYKNFGSASLDYIVIGNMVVTGATGSPSQTIYRFYGNNTSFASPTASVATIGLFPSQTFTFDNSFSKNNTFPIGSPSIVNAIPDNYIDSKNPGSIRLLPNITTPNDFNASIFTGTGVTNDLLTLSAVPTNSAFNITMNHVDPNGCASQINEQYVVYDHVSPISKKLGVVTNSTTIPQGSAQALSNSNFPSASSPILSQTILHNELAGYELVSLTADLPASVIKGEKSQIISGSDWQLQVKKIPNAPVPVPVPPLGTYYNYTWDYSHILNALTEPGANPGNTIKLDPYYGDLTDRFDAVTSKKNTYWKGGSLGQVEFTGLYRSTADLSVYLPFRQDVELFVPAVPLIEVGSSNQSSFDPIDGTKNFDGKTPDQHVNKFLYTNPNGYQGTSIFCEAGSIITLNGFPAALAGTSSGNFAIYDYYSYDFNTNTGSALLAPAKNSPFVDNGNGSMTLDPSDATVKNGYNDILVTYTYQDNNSPAVGIGYLVIRITPNPVAKFTVASIVGNPGASAFNAFCSSNKINFDASNSSIAQDAAKTNSIKSYTWDFNDPNSGSLNSATGSATSHTYSASSVYQPVLSLVSNWGCNSLSVTDNAPAKQSNSVLYTGTTGSIKVGGIPQVSFAFTGNCKGDSIIFTDKSQLVNNNNNAVSISKWAWDFGDGSPVGSGNAPVYIYQNPGSYNVKLVATTNVAVTEGCQNTLSIPISILPYQKPLPYPAPGFVTDFESSSENWQVLDLSSGAVSPSWSYASSGVTGKSNSSELNTGGKFWVTNPSGSYTLNEKSALYTDCFNFASPNPLLRPMISFDSFTDFPGSDGVVLQYSTDNLNITDPNKKWTVLGKITNGQADGLDWFNATAIASSPGSNQYNSTGLGWSGTTTNWAHSKHSLDTLLNVKRAIFRFALGSSSGSSGSSGRDGFAIDNFRVGSRTRTILFENFSTTDGGSVTLNNTLTSEANYITGTFLPQTKSGTQLVNINYHVGFLGNDPFNLDNPADPSARALFYNVSKVPYALLDGKHSSNVAAGVDSALFSKWGRKAYDLQTLQLAKVDFTGTTVTPNSDGTLTINVKVTPGNTGLGAGTTLQIAVLEKSISADTVKAVPGKPAIQTGEQHFVYVLKKMLPSAVGTLVTIPASTNPQQTDLGTFSWVPEHIYERTNKIAVIIFLQDEHTREVYQSEIYYKDLPPLVTAIEPISSENIKVYPNPADQEFVIELPYAAKESMSIQLANQLGQFTQLGSFSEGEQSKKVSTQGLADGVYILQLGSNGDALRTKIIVLHK